ncbi:MAG: IS1595 family transposase, partial [Holophagales bacterium]|nr:IS1595 family transposase [Holophagales bacterium]
MCKVTISAFQMIQKFPDNESARLHIERIRWNGKPVCPRCNSSEKQYAQNRKYEPGYYICATCEKTYTVRTGTIFERSHVDLHKWLFAIYLVCTARKGISSLQLSKEIGVTQKTAWFMLQRIRQACEDDNGNDDGNPDGFLKGVVEVDEVYVGGLESNKHESKKQPEGCRYRDKAVVLGIKERDGKVMAKHVPSSKSKDVRPIIRKSVAEGSTLCTDEFCVYADMHKWYDHKTVQHSAKQYVDGKAHT